MSTPAVHSQIPDLPGGERVTNSGLVVPECIGSSPNEQTFPAGLAEEIRAATADPAPAPELDQKTEQPEPSNPRDDDRTSPAPTPAATPALTEETESEPETKRPALMSMLLGEKVEAEVPKSAVIVSGVFLAPVAVIAFSLSFQITLPLIENGGWSGTVALMGPLLLDAAAMAAAIFGTLSRHYLFVRSGRLLLLLATVLSVWLNMDGHAFYADRHPDGAHSTALLAYSFAVPIILAILIHLFGTALGVYLEQKYEREREERAEEEARAEQRRRLEAQLEAERQQAAAEAARREERISRLPKPERTGQKVTRDVGVAYALAHRSFEQDNARTILRDALTDDGWCEPSPSAMTDWNKRARQAFTAEQASGPRGQLT